MTSVLLPTAAGVGNSSLESTVGLKVAGLKVGVLTGGAKVGPDGGPELDPVLILLARMFFTIATCEADSMDHSASSRWGWRGARVKNDLKADIRLSGEGGESGLDGVLGALVSQGVIGG